MGFFRQFAEYLFLKRRDPNAPRSINLGLMHGINRITTLIFLAGMILLLYRCLIHH
ncbi:MAG TPA: DUF6728 family protein [Dinghuibacter sp.]|uniref:DUF6728 family protein n=1 Tax=Dinghuibacter sp. TaxID=2024697 RepID=UPI002CC2C5F1|nr:DUF6728 family protein [Dinghuibacter sp.]HTJ13104.1 DUF6728 family protein [Dinghuibacter sp.]